MKWITTPQIYFALSAAAATAVFQAMLSFQIAASAFTGVWLTAGLFFAVMFSIGWYFGKKDKAALPLAITAFRFHLITFVVYNSVTLLWHVAAPNGRGSSYVLGVPLLVWTAALLLHFIIFSAGRRERIKGLRKEDIFE